MNFFTTIPVSDLERTKAFYNALGWPTNEQMSDQNGACFQVTDGVFLMTARRDFFASLTGGAKEVGDPAKTSMVTFAFDFPSRDEVDAFLEKAETAGAKM